MALKADHAVVYVRIPLDLRKRIDDDLIAKPYGEGSWRRRSVQSEILKLMLARWPVPAARVVRGPQLDLPGTKAKRKAVKKGGRK